MELFISKLVHKMYNIQYECVLFKKGRLNISSVLSKTFAGLHRNAGNEKVVEEGKEGGQREDEGRSERFRQRWRESM